VSLLLLFTGGKPAALPDPLDAPHRRRNRKRVQEEELALLVSLALRDPD